VWGVGRVACIVCCRSRAVPAAAAEIRRFAAWCVRQAACARQQLQLQLLQLQLLQLQLLLLQLLLWRLQWLWLFPPCPVLWLPYTAQPHQFIFTIVMASRWDCRRAGRRGRVDWGMYCPADKGGRMDGPVPVLSHRVTPKQLASAIWLAH